VKKLEPKYLPTPEEHASKGQGLYDRSQRGHDIGHGGPEQSFLRACVLIALS
jgi:hypothetical protein